MNKTVANLKVGEKGIIKDICLNDIPLKLVEMGCMPGKEVVLKQIAPLNDPLYITVNGSHLAIRKDIAKLIQLESTKNKQQNLCETIKS
jgi:ferrous iron transport protein A